MKTSVYLSGLAGLIGFTVLIAYQGVADVASALAVAGWGLALVAAFHLLPMLADTLGWYVLFDRKDRPSLPTLLWARWIGESVNGLLPVAQVGGDVVKARWLMHRGIPGALSGATVVVDLTVSVFTQIVFTVMGLVLLLIYLGDHRLGGDRVVGATLAGVALSILPLGGFYLAQKQGLFVALSRILKRVGMGGSWTFLEGGAEALDAAVTTLYGKRRALLAASIWRLVGWGVGTGEVWLALHFLGAPIGLFEALLLESLSQAVRAAAFVVPGALGVQEGGYLVLGALLGLGPESALALALARRVRELSLGLPGLLAWQIGAGRRLWRQGERANVVAADTKPEGPVP